MGDILIPDLVEETTNGVFARHPVRFQLPVLVAPTTIDRGNATNIVRQHLVTVACVNLADYNFAFDSSLLEPQSDQGFANLAKLIALYPGSPLSIFGHTDPEGEAVYNKFLSERRARAVFGLLLRRPEIWEQLFSDKNERQHAAGDVWGARAIQTMLTRMAFPVAIDGKGGNETNTAFTRFLASHASGAPPTSAAARKILFLAYMDSLAGPRPGDPTKFFQLEPSDFLGGAKTPLGAPGDLQGCSEFNPQLILAAAEERDFAKAGPEGKEARHEANKPNRRVVIYLFEKGAEKPANWPCPAAASPDRVKGCERRFWSDGKKRQSLAFEQHRRRFGRVVPDAKRELKPPNAAAAARFGAAETTFGCRFYHGFSVHSPCEHDLKMWVLRLFAGGPDAPLANVRWVAQIGTDAESPILRGTTGDKGTIGLPLFDENVLIALKLDVGPVLLSGLGPPVTTIDAVITPVPIVDRITREQPARPPGNGGPLAGEVGAVSKTEDPQAFPSEETFMILELDAGALARLQGPPAPDPGASDFDADDPPPLTDAEKRRGAAQRLRNLAFGGKELLTDRVQFTAAVREFQLIFRAPDKVTGVLDAETEAELAKRYGESIPTEVPPA